VAVDPATITVRELATLGDRSSASSINNQGWIGGTTNRLVGDADDFAAIWSPGGTLIDADPGGTLFSWVADIAPNGVALVSAVVGPEDVDAYAWTPTGGALAVVGLSGRPVTFLGGINSEGEIVGAARDANGESQAFHWGAGGFTLLSLTSVTKAEASANDINDDGLIGATARRPPR
jgi:probable HAF family extracellular repeat protein